MLAGWTKLLPYFVVVWLIKRNAERTRVQSLPEFVSTTPYKGVVFSWRR